MTIDEGRARTDAWRAKRDAELAAQIARYEVSADLIDGQRYIEDLRDLGLALQAMVIVIAEGHPRPCEQAVCGICSAVRVGLASMRALYDRRVRP